MKVLDVVKVLAQQKVKRELKNRVEDWPKNKRREEMKKLEKMKMKLNLKKALRGKIDKKKSEIEEKELDDIIAELKEEDKKLKEKEKEFAKEKKKLHWYRDEEDAQMRAHVRYLRSMAAAFDRSEMTNPLAALDNNPQFKDAVEAALGEDMSGHFGTGDYGAIKKTGMWKKLVEQREEEEKKNRKEDHAKPGAKTKKGFDWGGLSEEDKKKKKALLREIKKNGNAGGENDEGKAFMKSGFHW